MIHTPRRCGCPAEVQNCADRWTKRWQRIRRDNPTSLDWATHKAKQVLKPVLHDMAHGKCVFCESALEVTSHLEIEHYVAKTRDPGRAFEWTNLLPSCSKCNNAKGEQDHANSLLKPDDEDPEPFFWIHPDTGELEPHPTLDEAGRKRAAETIRICNLQRAALCTKRTQMMARVFRWLEMIATAGVLSNTLREEWQELLDPRTEYKFVLRQVLSSKDSLLWPISIGRCSRRSDANA
jgi:uncharacterized protein (TIGR02646 family)